MESISITPAASALHQRVLSHLVTMAKADRYYAWSAAKNYAKLDPFQLATMPDDLTRVMLKCSPST
jgi:hypothetical protein